LNFDKEGDLMIPVDGTGVSFAKPLMLDNSTAEDTETLAIAERYREDMEEYTKVIGENRVLLKLKGYSDSNIGNILTDSMVDAWDGDADMGFINNGGVRSVIIEGDITGEDIFNVLPFNNTIDRVQMTGKAIRSRLENVIKDLCPDKSCYSSFWQVSGGVRLIYRIEWENQGHRIEKFQVKDSNDTWCDVKDDQEYKIVMPSFLATSKYGDIRQHANNHEVGPIDYDAFKTYVEAKQIIDEEEDGFGRIGIIWDTAIPTSTTTSSGTKLNLVVFQIVAIILISLSKMV
jgi:2',3'-cyclic-nucleotide 2'-phosphodiesterase (5'-nucleotidase family)